MGEDSFKNLVVGFVLFGLFSLLIITFVTQMGVDNGVDTSEITGGGLGIDSLNDSLQDFSSTSENYREQFEDGDFSDVDSPTGIFSVLKNFVTILFSPFTFIGNVLENVLGVPPIFTNIVLGVIILIIILGIWRVLRSGS